MKILLVAVLVFVVGTVTGIIFGFGWWSWVVFGLAAGTGIVMGRRRRKSPGQ